MLFNIEINKNILQIYICSKYTFIFLCFSILY
uniref:Uncharacterized protein n=1 Tax=Zymomonas mobilis subsp. mobilis (strain ATCC 31821 / ZM4 / CP4) TaxID=264203 RepID=Q8GF45_ZYMMO|nr:unknown [Zymomonas mobilis subsp. mobilis ZM4 = ATCC 31821]